MSKIVRFRKHLHCSKEDNWDLVAHFGDEDLKYCGYEEELIYEYNTETKEVTLVGAGGRLLSGMAVDESELVDIPQS
jgi:hypothetical protein